jgi:hypothetical protein
MKSIGIPSLLIAIALPFLAPYPVCAAPLELLTAVEAAQGDPKPGTGNAQELPPIGAAPDSAPGAPQIIVDTPGAGGAVSAPFPVKIRFIPESGAKINLDSLKVEVLKIIPISLLGRIKPYLTAAGINVPEAKIPTGAYRVHIAVADDHGRLASTVETWTVH